MKSEKRSSSSGVVVSSVVISIFSKFEVGWQCRDARWKDIKCLWVVLVFSPCCCGLFFSILSTVLFFIPWLGKSLTFDEKQKKN